MNTIRLLVILQAIRRSTAHVPFANSSVRSLSVMDDAVCTGIDLAESDVGKSVAKAGVSAAAAAVGTYAGGPGAGLIAGKATSFGFGLLFETAKIAVDTYVRPQFCKSHSTSAEAKETTKSWTGRRAHNILQAAGIQSDVSLFDTTMPEDADPFKCRSYPTEHFQFCAKLGHNYQVSEAFNDNKFAVGRSAEVENTWRKLKDQKPMSKLINSHMVCEYSLRDALCVDAVPSCLKKNDMVCTMPCRNLQLCYAELYDTHDRNLLESITATCSKQCQSNSLSLRPPVHREDSADIDVYVGAEVIVRGAGSEQWNGKYTAKKVYDTTNVKFGSAIEFVKNDHMVLTWFPENGFPAAWYMCDPLRGWHTVYYLMAGTEFKLPQAKWRVFSGQDYINSKTNKAYGTNGHRANGKLPVPVTVKPASSASRLFSKLALQGKLFASTRSQAILVIGALVAAATVLSLMIRVARRKTCNTARVLEEVDEEQMANSLSLALE